DEPTPKPSIDPTVGVEAVVTPVPMNTTSNITPEPSNDPTESPTSAQLISTPSPTGPPSHSPSSAGKLVSPVSAAPIMWCTVVVSHVLH
ncbi:hypothetical protein ACHAWU_000594, partial [Discostella pseudostelligera]